MRILNVENFVTPIRRTNPLLLVVLLITASPTQADKVDDYVRSEMSQRRIPGLSLAVVKAGRVIRSKGYGLSDLELNVPATPDSVYQIESMTKQLTAAGIMLLGEDGKVSLDETVDKYLSDLPITWKDVTVRHLLTHTSGIKDFADLADTEAERAKDYTKAQIISLVSGAPLEFRPGEKWNYSNTGYFLLGMVMERVSGKAYGVFLQDRVFRPLGMSAPRLNDLNESVPNRAAGYV